MTAWTAQRERGSAALLAVMLRITRAFGWPVARALLIPITLWFLATSPKARAASRDYLGRALGRPARLRDVARHFHAFACSLLDRGFFLLRRAGHHQITVDGLHQVEAALASGRGCLLLGAHIGSFEALRVVGRDSPVRVWAMMFRRNAGPLTALLDRLDPGLLANVIELGAPDAMLRAQEAILRGEIVGVLADRAPPCGHTRTVWAPFLGREAPFPAGPFILAHVLGAPVFIVHAVSTGARRYHVSFQPFADRLTLPRANRDVALRRHAARFSAALGAACRAHPFEWFNFFPFWELPSDAAASHHSASPRQVAPLRDADGPAGDSLPAGAVAAARR